MNYQVITDFKGVKHPVSLKVVSLIEERALVIYIGLVLRKMSECPEYKDTKRGDYLYNFLCHTLDEHLKTK